MTLDSRYNYDFLFIWGTFWCIIQSIIIIHWIFRAHIYPYISCCEIRHHIMEESSFKHNEISLDQRSPKSDDGIKSDDDIKSDDEMNGHRTIEMSSPTKSAMSSTKSHHAKTQ